LPPSIKILKERTAIVRAVRSFFFDQDFLEVETPIRIPAPAPEAYIDPQESGTWFLQTSPELCMKRLLCSGCQDIFQICKCFRKNERGHLHLPEMTMLEWYRSHADYHQLMTDCEALLQFLVPEQLLTVDNATIYLAPPWPQITLEDAFRQFSRTPLRTALLSGKFEEVLVGEVEPHLGIESPVFITDYPAELASLASLTPGNPETAQRCELYINGIEIANGFSELNDPDEQRRRFENELATIRAAGRKPGPMPEKFLDDLALMPESAGIALGLDRLVMLLTNCKRIDQVVTFAPEAL
jgi:lysyl-tRNA synthetase class 2